MEKLPQNPVESYLRNELIDGMEQNKKGIDLEKMAKRFEDFFATTTPEEFEKFVEESRKRNPIALAGAGEPVPDFEAKMKNQKLPWLLDEFPQKYRDMGYTCFEELVPKAMSFYLNGGDEILTYCVQNNIRLDQLTSEHKYWQTEAIKRLEEATKK